MIDHYYGQYVREHVCFVFVSIARAAIFFSVFVSIARAATFFSDRHAMEGLSPFADGYGNVLSNTSEHSIMCSLKPQKI